MKNRKSFIVIVGIMGVCIFSTVACVLTTNRIEQQNSKSGCSPPVGEFSETTLVGTWMAGNPEHMDSLIVRADGTYKQIVHVKLANGQSIDYESDWQPWYLEYSEDQIPYLHLTGFAFCGMNTDISCEKRDGGGYDFCRDKHLTMNDEGILILLEARGGDKNYYYLFYPLGSENSYIYSFQGP